MDEILAPELVAEIAESMGIASTRELRGQRDAIGFATRAEEIDACLAAAAEPPSPLRLAGEG